MQPSWVSLAFSNPSENAPSAGDLASMATMESLYQNRSIALPSAVTFLRVPLGRASASQILEKLPGTGGRVSAAGVEVSASASARTTRETARVFLWRSAADFPVEILPAGAARRVAFAVERLEARAPAAARTTGAEVMVNADISSVFVWTLRPVALTRSTVAVGEVESFECRASLRRLV